MRGPAIAFAVTCTATLISAAPALAADRYASPDGDGPEPCAASDRCNVLSAVNDAGPGDRVFLAPGDYGSPTDRIPGSLDNAGDRVEIVGELRRADDGVWQRPVVYLANSNATVELTGDGGSISDVTIDSASSIGALGSTPSNGGASVTLDRVLVRERTGFFACAFSNDLPQAVRSSACLADRDDAVAINVQGSLDLRNVTALATGANGIGLSYTNAAGPTSVSATNSILRGTGGVDVKTFDAGTSTTLDLVNSSYSTIDNFNGATVVTETGKQDAAPLLADPAAGNLRQLEGSPTIDAGVADPAAGNFDLDGNARVQRSATDIGAYELAPDDTPPPGEGTPPTNPPPPRTITVIRISRISVAAKRAKVDRNGRLAIPLSCRGGGTRCRGLIALTANVRLPGHRGKSEVVLARTRFVVSPSRTAKIRVRLGRAARELLAEARNGRLAAQLRLTAGADERVNKLTLIGPAPKLKRRR